MYKTIRGTMRSVEMFEAEVSKSLAQGWQTHGDIVVYVDKGLTYLVREMVMPEGAPATADTIKVIKRRIEILEEDTSELKAARHIDAAVQVEPMDVKPGYRYYSKDGLNWTIIEAGPDTKRCRICGTTEVVVDTLTITNSSVRTYRHWCYDCRAMIESIAERVTANRFWLMEEGLRDVKTAVEEVRPGKSGDRREVIYACSFVAGEPYMCVITAENPEHAAEQFLDENAGRQFSLSGEWRVLVGDIANDDSWICSVTISDNPKYVAVIEGEGDEEGMVYHCSVGDEEMVDVIASSGKEAARVFASLRLPKQEGEDGPCLVRVDDEIGPVHYWVFILGDEYLPIIDDEPQQVQPTIDQSNANYTRWEDGSRHVCWTGSDTDEWHFTYIEKETFNKLRYEWVNYRVGYK